MSEVVLRRLTEELGAAVEETGSHVGDEWAYLAPDAIRAACAFLRDDPDLAFELPIDLTAVDYRDWTGAERPRFEVVYHLCSVRHKHRIRLKIRVSEDAPAVPSVADIYPGLGWFEREAWDMFGIRFEGHPDLRRMLLPEEFEGHPLRKDYLHRDRQPRVPMRDIPGADIEDPALGPQARPPALPGEPVWRGEPTVAPAKPEAGSSVVPGSGGGAGGGR